MESFGARLKREREKRGLTLDAISVTTKIGARFLRALEQEDFEQLPGGIFNKGFVRAYARELGLDEDQIVADFLAASGAAQSIAESLPQPQFESQIDPAAGLPWGTFAIALLLLALGFAFWGIRSQHTPAQQKVRNAPDVIPAPAATPPTAAVQEVSASGAPLQTALIMLTIKANQESWISITADGKQIMQDTLTEGTSKSIEARKQVAIRAGNIGGLDFEFNGKRLPAQGDEGEAKTLTFDTTGLQKN